MNFLKRIIKLIFNVNNFLVLTILMLGFLIGWILCYVKYLKVVKYSPIVEVMDEVQKHDYDINTYNCVDFSRDAQRRLKEKGIGSTLIVGYKKDSPVNHAYIGVWIDPQTGEFVNDYNFYGTIEP